MMVESMLFAGLENDCRSIMSQIEKKLHELHSEMRSSNTVSAMEVDDVSNAQSVQRIPFAHIDQVEPASPAFTAVS